MTIVDADSHLDERPDMWSEYSPAGDRDLALHVREDELGYAWLMLRERPLYLLDTFEVGNWAKPGELRNRRRAGLRIREEDRLENTPACIGDPAPWLEEQLRLLSAAGIREAMVCPGLIGGLRPSHPLFDPVWQLFVENDMALA